MVTRINRIAVGALSSVLIVGLAWAGTPLSQADQLSDAKDKLVALQAEASQAEEQYNQAQASLDAAEAKLAQTQESITAQQALVDSMRDQVAVFGLQQLQDMGIASTAALLASSNHEDALNRLLMSSQVADTTTALLQNYQLAQAGLDDLERSQEATVASIKADKEKQQQVKDDAAKKVNEAQRLVNQLTAAQQAALAGTSVYPSRGTSNYAPPPPVQNGAAAQAIVNWAMARVGYPYVYGGSGPNAYDCSGFTMAAYATVGIRLPHSATTQFNYGAPVARADLEPGDLVFFYSGPGHVGIYVGGGMIVDARNESLGVVYRPLDQAMPITGARRLL